MCASRRRSETAQVIELATQAIARAKARETVRLEGEARLAQLQHRTTVQVFLLTIAGVLLVGMLALINVRERRGEIGVLRALGTSTAAILRLFLTKAVLVGLFGAVLGVGVGYAFAERLTEFSGDLGLLSSSLFSPRLLSVIALTPTLTLAASWVPALLAARQDPADVLSSD